MNVTLQSKVTGNYQEVMSAFDRKLFEALKPPVGEMEIVSFTGSKSGDKVHLRFLKPFMAEWISDIVEDGETEKEAWFVDVGTTLPWPLKTWRHKHIVKKLDEQTSLIVDDMTFTGKNKLLSLLLVPGIFLAFYPRKMVYKRYFEALFGNQ
jgi:ligand-binding SRPBCC domain-containing protein